MTLVLRVDPENPERDKIEIAAKLIKKGELVAFPTETVYGLGADALNAEAVKKIFRVKGRPLDNPLIVHIAHAGQVEELARDVPELARKLIKAFFPGPLTLVLKKSPVVPKETTAGLDTIAIRMPANRVALELIKASTPIAAPSANLSGKPSPTRAEHVLEDFQSKIACIIDAGECRIGLESTVVLPEEDRIKILRPGGITKEQLEKFGEVEIASGGDRPLSPGMKYRHYSPEAELWIARDVKQAIQEAKNLGRRIGVIAMEKPEENVEFYPAGRTLEEYASRLFHALRELDSRGVDIIIAEAVEERGIGLAIMNRLKKAATKVVQNS